jgi:hypothetical protein
MAGLEAMIDLTINEKQLEMTIQRAKNKGTIIFYICLVIKSGTRYWAY